LQRPASGYSYLLQEWDMTLGCESSFGRVAATLEEVLGLKQSVDILERMSRQMAELVPSFRASRPRPADDEEAAVVVTQADGKGGVIRRAADEPKIQGHRRKGQKAKKKRMAIVGTISTIDRARRTAEEVIASLFRDPKASRPDPGAVPWPEPLHKHVWAGLSYEQDGQDICGTEEVFSWLSTELALRNPDQRKETVHLMDGQESLWTAAAASLPRANVVEELDLWHVTARVWEAAHLFFKEGSDEATAFAGAVEADLGRGGLGGGAWLASYGDPPPLGGDETEAARDDLWVLPEERVADAIRRVPGQGLPDRQRGDRGGVPPLCIATAFQDISV
jgi:hypothetical protein